MPFDKSFEISVCIISISVERRLPEEPLYVFHKTHAPSLKLPYGKTLPWCCLPVPKVASTSLILQMLSIIKSWYSFVSFTFWNYPKTSQWSQFQADEGFSGPSYSSRSCPLPPFYRKTAEYFPVISQVEHKIVIFIIGIPTMAVDKGLALIFY